MSSNCAAYTRPTKSTLSSVALLIVCGVVSVFMLHTRVLAEQDSCFITPTEHTPAAEVERALRACEHGLGQSVKALLLWERNYPQTRENLQTVNTALSAFLAAYTESGTAPPEPRPAETLPTDAQILSQVERNTSAVRQLLTTNALHPAWHTILQQFINRLEIVRSIVTYHRSHGYTLQKKIRTYENAILALREHQFGIRAANALPLEQALAYTKQAADRTGVRHEFLLGVLKNESSLGHYIGTSTYRVAMHPIRDQMIFPYLTDVLGYQPETLPVSADPGPGWGGAMGPAQFIPSTWVCYGGFVNTRTDTCTMTDLFPRSTKTLRIGSRGAAVQRLQEFLNTHGFTIAESGHGSPGNETDLYTPAVSQAVARLQKHYATLIPTRHESTSGVVGWATRDLINQINFYSGPWEYRAERDHIRRLTHSTSPANPWNPRDAFFASALFLRNLGAAYDECQAARKYYAGSRWQSSAALNYCRAVVSKARFFEEYLRNA